MIEEWRPWRRGDYEVSNMGRVRRATPGRKTHVGLILKPAIVSTGYHAFSPVIDGKQHRTYIHRAVAELFIGPCPDGQEVNHIDGVKGNNAVSNLEYVTRSQNMRHAIAIGLVVHKPRQPRPSRWRTGPLRGDAHWMKHKPERIARGENAGSAKLTNVQAEQIRARHQNGERQCDLAEVFGISKAQVCRIVNRKQRVS